MKTMKILMLLVAAMFLTGCQVTVLPSDDPNDVIKAEAEKNEAAILERIRTMKIVQQESVLIRDILLLKAEIAKIQSVEPPEPPRRQPNNPNRQPVEIPELGVEGEFIPLDELPKDMQ